MYTWSEVTLVTTSRKCESCYYTNSVLLAFGKGSNGLGEFIFKPFRSRVIHILL